MLVLSHARNLAGYVDSTGNPTAGMRNAIPQHLQATNKLLQNYGFHLAQRHGKGTRRLIKFDDIERNIYLSYKIPSSDAWHTITPAMATKYREKENERNLASFSGTLSPPHPVASSKPRSFPISYASGANLTTPGNLPPGSSQRGSPSRWRPPPTPRGWGGNSDRN